MTAFTNPTTPSPFGPFAVPPRVDDAFTAWNTVATFDDYAGAQKAVDTLSDSGFPVQSLDIVGTDVRLVERVTGRLTTRKAASAGAASGAWFGLFMGFLLGIFTSGSWLGLLVVGVVIGAAWGGLFGFLGHRATRGMRDFASARTLVASHYALVARDGRADAARQALFGASLRTAV